MTDGPPVSHQKATLLRKGQDALRRRAWGEAYANLSAADRDSPLQPADLSELAVAAHLLGRDNEVEDLLRRAHRAFLAIGEIPRAVRSAFWLAMILFERGDFAPAGGWLGRAQGLLEESRLDCVEQGYLLLPSGIQGVAENDSAAAYAAFQQAAKIAERFADSDLLALTRLGRGQALIQMREIREASALFDEAMAAITVGEVSPLVAGIVFCGVIDGCGQIFDLIRAHQWTVALSAWCDSQPDIVLYRGRCLVYRAEILQSRGAWDEALEEAKLACERLSSPLRVPEAAEAFYRLGELHRVKGRFSEAEEAYRRASELGREPQPGLAQLRLAEGRADVARAAIQRVVGEAMEPAARCRALIAQVEIMLAVGDAPAGQAAVEELDHISADFKTPLLEGLTAHAHGAVLLALGDVQGALNFLRSAGKIWLELQVPYEAARGRVLIGLACRQLGDDDTAELELHAAHRVFAELGAAPEIAAVEALTQKPAGKRAGGLTLREVQVLHLVAAGKTNRAIGETLFISEKTVDRHLSNIFGKLNVSSRAAATAMAYEQGLL